MIRVVRVYNRSDCCPERLLGFEIRVGNDPNMLSNPICKMVAG